MILIIGGAYQGKLDYVINKFHTIESDIYCCNDSETSPDFSKKVFYNFHNLVLAQTKNHCDSVQFVKENLENLKDKIIICDDVSCGIVPIDPEIRAFRESLGRSLAFLSQNADEVIRIFCGLETKLK